MKRLNFAHALFAGLTCWIAVTLGTHAASPITDLSTPGDRWFRLDECLLLRDKYRDGDSFHVLHGTNEYVCILPSGEQAKDYVLRLHKLERRAKRSGMELWAKTEHLAQ